MTRAQKSGVVFAAFMMMAPAVTFAQTSAGSIAGIVKDTTGAVLQGVTVEASSPALIEKVRTVVTDGEGRYQVIGLRPGVYTVAFTLEGFSAVKRQGIQLTTGFTATVDVELPIGSVAQTITVFGQPPIVDVLNTKQQVVITRDVVDSIPTGKSFQNLAVLIPGIVGSGVIGSTIPQDVGGQSGQNFMALSIHGGRPSDQQIQVDGMPMMSWARVDASANMFADGNVQEFAIDVAGNSADVEAGGVRINMIPRDGGNALKGSFFANVSSPRLQSENVTTELKQRGLGDPNRLERLWSVNTTVGGPVVRNRIWYFATYTELRSDQLVAGSYLSSDPTAWLYAADKSRQAVDDQIGRDGAVRVTVQASPRNKVSLYYDDNYNCHCHYRIGGAVKSDASVYSHYHNHVYQATWSSPITNRVLVELGASSAPQDQNFDARPESVAPRITDIGYGISYRAGTPIYHALTTNPGGRGSASYVTGSHAVKLGFTLTTGTFQRDTKQLGNVMFTLLNGTPTQVTYVGDPVTVVNRVRPNLGVYAQDQWRLKQITINAGGRFDYFRTGYPDQAVAPTQYVPVARSFPALEAINWKDLSPRLGFSYDPFGDGKTAVKGSVNRYVLQTGTDYSFAINPLNNNNTMDRQWNDSNRDYVVQGDPFDPAANGELGPSLNLNFGKPGITTRYDPEWSHGFGLRPYQWEFSAGVQHELLPRVSVNGAFFRRIYGNFAVTDNLAVGPADYSGYCVTAPSDVRLPGGGQQVCGLFDLNPAKVGQSASFGTSASKFGRQYEHWNGLDLTADARLPRLLLQGGLSTGKTVTDNCDVVAKVDNPSTRFCHRETPFLTQVKLLWAYTLPWDFQLAGTYQTLPGPQVAASATFTNAQIAPSLGRSLSSGSTASIDLVEPGTLFGERLHQVDLRITKVLQVERSRFQVMLDLYNALNNNAVLAQSNIYGATTGPSTGTAWLVPQAIMPGRVVKFGIQLNF